MKTLMGHTFLFEKASHFTDQFPPLYTVIFMYFLYIDILLRLRAIEKEKRSWQNCVDG